MQKLTGYSLYEFPSVVVIAVYHPNAIICNIIINNNLSPISSGYIVIVTQHGPIADITVGRTAYLVADVQNLFSQPQNFSAITEVIDANGDTASSIKWVNGSIGGMQTIRTSSIWIPEEAGNYTIKILIWTGNIDNKSPPAALAESKTMTLQIYE